ncbi:glycosyltransferase family 2 protein [Lacticaseibacillus sp. 53-4]|uniref:glycosyltransferase family 2 protein n=1 Tax=Lacticaseibacillus sp. 53-4 TaxID=2799575 RepID=UPI001943B488|nr:glycosyltransferase family 2 protein [Lacticaseibacillus sp. 53-4]
MTEPTITICLSAYNGERFLAEQLASFQAQTYQNWQLLIHDDGSTDHTVEIVRKYAQSDSRIHLADLGGHLGIKRAFIALLKEQDTDFYAFSDQDDVWEPEKLTTLVDALASENSEKPLLAYSRFSEIDSGGRPLPEDDRHPIYSTAFKDFLMINTVTGCTVLLNRSLRNKLLAPSVAVNYSLMTMHDAWAALVASAFGNVIFVDQPLVRYRQHGDNVLGAPGTANLLVRIARLLKFREAKIVGGNVRQTGEFLRCYQGQLAAKEAALAEGVAAIFDDWAPIKKISFLRREHLFVKSNSLNIQIKTLLWLPTPLRRYILGKATK